MMQGISDFSEGWYNREVNSGKDAFQNCVSSKFEDVNFVGTSFSS